MAGPEPKAKNDGGNQKQYPSHRIHPLFHPFIPQIHPGWNRKQQIGWCNRPIWAKKMPGVTPGHLLPFLNPM
nr:MAG TPA: hypothetical protein [Caudoviricetes sp.]